MEDEVNLLAKPLQNWVASRKWKALQPIQKEAIRAIVSSSGEYDFVLSATTASGKTEAAFLPLLTKIYGHSEKALPSFEILYVSPLKALINDMAERVGSMAACVGRRAYRRHGDVPDAERAGSRGILLTTPESLEAQFIRSSDSLALTFKDLRAVVIDEIHAYFESPRGPQLVSLLTRLEAVLAQENSRNRHKVERVALSATVSGPGGDGEKSLKAFLRPDDPDHVKILCPETVRNPIKVFLRVFTDSENPTHAARRASKYRRAVARLHGEGADIDVCPRSVQEIANSLFDVFTGCHKGLIFTNSRREAEDFAEILNAQAREKGLVRRPPDPPTLDDEYSTRTRRFWPHHGSLHRSIRSRAEKIMRDDNEKSVLVCTTTLELGIDIGTVEATAQVGPGYSVSSLRQRLGRSGRREGRIPTLHSYVKEAARSEDAHPVEKLYLQTFRTLAQINLLEKGAFESADLQRLNLSTLIQQLLSCVHQQQDEAGLDPTTARTLLVENGPFGSAGDLLEPLIEHLLTKYKSPLEKQNSSLFLSPYGRRYVEHFSFYAAFNTPEEYLVRAGSRRIGTFAPRYMYGPGDQFLLAGAFWEVVRVDHIRHVMEVTRASGGRAPYFQGDALAASDLIVQEMQRLYAATETPELPRHSNEAAREVVRLGRIAYRQMFREHPHAIEQGSSVVLFPWVGARKQVTLLCALKWMGLCASTMDVALVVRDTTPENVLTELKRLLDGTLPSEHDLARYAAKVIFEKHDNLLSPALRRVNFASAKLAVGSLPSIIRKLLGTAALP